MKYDHEKKTRKGKPRKVIPEKKRKKAKNLTVKQKK